MWRKRTEEHPEFDPVRIGGKRTLVSLAVITIIAIALLLIIRFTIL